jgi:hypothetical protein
MNELPSASRLRGAMARSGVKPLTAQRHLREMVLREEALRHWHSARARKPQSCPCSDCTATAK